MLYKSNLSSTGLLTFYAAHTVVLIAITVCLLVFGLEPHAQYDPASAGKLRNEVIDQVARPRNTIRQMTDVYARQQADTFHQPTKAQPTDISQ